jgi:hypothetical protein
MFKSSNAYGNLIFICGLLTIFGGLMGIAIPPALEDVIVPLVRKAPPDDVEVYATVGRHLATSMSFYYSAFIILGLVTVSASWLAFFRNEKT